MTIKDRYTTEDNPRWGAIVRDGLILLAGVILLAKLWPFYSVPTGSRGVVTHSGKLSASSRKGSPFYRRGKISRCFQFAPKRRTSTTPPAQRRTRSR